MITHVAIIIDDVIFALPKPNRHQNIFLYLYERDVIVTKIPEQGFLDENNKFLTRTEARDYAIECGQITKSNHESKLNSNDLW